MERKEKAQGNADGGEGKDGGGEGEREKLRAGEAREEVYNKERRRGSNMPGIDEGGGGKISGRQKQAWGGVNERERERERDKIAG